MSKKDLEVGTPVVLHDYVPMLVEELVAERDQWKKLADVLRTNEGRIQGVLMDAKSRCPALDEIETILNGPAGAPCASEGEGPGKLGVTDDEALEMLRASEDRLDPDPLALDALRYADATRSGEASPDDMDEIQFSTRDLLTFAGSTDAREWLKRFGHGAEERGADEHDVVALSALLAEVRRETIEACSEMVRRSYSDTPRRKDVLTLISALFTSSGGGK